MPPPIPFILRPPSLAHFIPSPNLFLVGQVSRYQTGCPLPGLRISDPEAHALRRVSGRRALIFSALSSFLFFFVILSLRRVQTSDGRKDGPG